MYDVLVGEEAQDEVRFDCYYCCSTFNVFLHGRLESRTGVVTYNNTVNPKGSWR